MRYHGNGAHFQEELGAEEHLENFPDDHRTETERLALVGGQGGRRR